MKNIDLVEMIDEISEKVCANIESVNSGGCGVFAAELGKRLQALGFKDVNCRVYNYEEECENMVFSDLNTLEQYLREHNQPRGEAEVWNDNGVYFSHVMLHVDGLLCDCEGYISADDPEAAVWSEDYLLLDGFVTIEAMAELACNPYNWNPTFPRSQIRLMTAIMDECIEKYTNKIAA